MARLIRTEKEVEGRYEEVWLVVEEDALDQWPAGARDVVGKPAPRLTGTQRARGEARFTADVRDSGHFVDCNRLQPPATATTVRVRNDKVSTTDGPFAETKEQLGGYYMLEARDLNEAIQIAARIPGARTGCVEVRPVAEDTQTLRALGVDVRR